MARPGRRSVTSRKISRRTLLAAGAALATVGRASAQTPIPPERIDLVRMAVSRLPVSMDPTQGNSVEDLWLETLCLDTPNRWNAGNQIVTSLTSYGPVPDDDSSVDLTVRPGALLYDGMPVRAVDVQYAIERVRNGAASGAHSWRTEHIKRVQVMDDQTVRLTLHRPDASLQATLAHQLFGVMRAGSNPPMIQGGSGPFYLQQRDGEGMLFRRNEHFWQIGRPHIESIRVEAIEDDVQRSTAISTGEIDLLPSVPLLDIPMLREEPTVYLVGGPSNRVCHVQLNLEMPELRDPRVRRLLSAAIDRVRLVEVATAGQAIPTGLLFSELSWAFGGVEEVATIEADVIREELRLLGIPSDLRLHLVTDDADATLANTAILLQEQLASCGIALSVDLLRDEELADVLKRRDFDMYAGYTQPWRDPHELVRPLLASDGNQNHSGYVSDDVDALIRGANLRPDRVFRQERYRRIEERVQRDAPVIVLFHPYYFDAVSTRLAGYGALPPVTSRGLLTVRPPDAESP